MKQRRRIDDGRSVRIEENQIRITPGRNCTLSIVKAGQLRRRGGEPRREMLDRQPACLGTSPDRGEADLDRGNTSPRRNEISGVDGLQDRRRG